MSPALLVALALISPPLGMLLHELAHGAAALAIGYRVTALRLGVGPPLAFGRLGGLAWSVSWLPGASLDFRRCWPAHPAGEALLLLAGPAVDLVFLLAWTALASALLEGGLDDVRAGVVLGGAFLFHLLGFLGNLFPHASGSRVTDGGRLVQLLRGQHPIQAPSDPGSWAADLGARDGLPEPRAALLPVEVLRDAHALLCMPAVQAAGELLRLAPALAAAPAFATSVLDQVLDRLPVVGTPAALAEARRIAPLAQRFEGEDSWLTGGACLQLEAGDPEGAAALGPVVAALPVDVAPVAWAYLGAWHLTHGRSHEGHRLLHAAAGTADGLQVVTRLTRPTPRSGTGSPAP